ncbi:hypothetical protein FNV43_RR02116 [Rhamnella rubrinervis]|uniref:Uncharacterized protein n=1 Tax=Rhamnella rubrinervis TaxID=2594499 RepID=A0A8K0HSM4_9ROSA|nr:hypothetical protein FNV43_RR02116 [Rhamnella rubrinervis]
MLTSNANFKEENYPNIYCNIAADNSLALNRSIQEEQNLIFLHREERSKCYQDLRLGKNLEWPEDPCKTEVHKIQNNKNDGCVDSESSNLKETGGICKIDVVYAFKEPQISQNGEKSNLISDVAQVDDHPNMLTPIFAGSDLNGSASGIDVKQFETVNSTRSSNTMCRAEKVAHGKNISGNSLPDQDGIGAQSMSKDLEKLQATLTSGENILSRTALKVIMTRRDKLSLQLRHIEDEIAQCDSKIQSILNGTVSLFLFIERGLFTYVFLHD